MILVSRCPYKKSLETYLMILVSIKVPIEKNLETFNDPRINETIQKEFGNLFNELRINKSAHSKKGWKLI